MPTYEYACRTCDTRLEVVQSFKDDPLETCDVCGGALRKVFSAAGIIFKGSGYYVTDTRGERRRSSSSESSAGDSSEGTSGDAASKTSSDTSSSKTEAKSGASDTSSSSAGDAKSA